MLLLLLFLIPVLGMVAFAIDAGMMVLLRTEVRNAVDSGSLAAALVLQSDPDAVTQAEDAARDYIQQNRGRPSFRRHRVGANPPNRTPDGCLQEGGRGDQTSSTSPIGEANHEKPSQKILD